LAHGLYTEVIDLTQLGRLQVRRATTITFDNAASLAREGPDRVSLFTSPSREKCLEWEQAYFSR